MILKFFTYPLLSTFFFLSMEKFFQTLYDWTIPYTDHCSETCNPFSHLLIFIADINSSNSLISCLILSSLLIFSIYNEKKKYQKIHNFTVFWLVGSWIKNVTVNLDPCQGSLDLLSTKKDNPSVGKCLSIEIRCSELVTLFQTSKFCFSWLLFTG